MMFWTIPKDIQYHIKSGHVVNDLPSLKTNLRNNSHIQQRKHNSSLKPKKKRDLNARES